MEQKKAVLLNQKLLKYIVISIFVLAFFLIQTPNSSAHPGQLGLPKIKVTVKLNEIFLTDDQDDGLDGESEIVLGYAVCHGDSCNHGTSNGTVSDQFLDWDRFQRSSPFFKVIYTHEECAPLDEIAVVFIAKESDQSIEYTVTSALTTAAGVAAAFAGTGVSLAVAAAGGVAWTVGLFNQDDDLGLTIDLVGKKERDLPIEIPRRSVKTKGKDGGLSIDYVVMAEEVSDPDGECAASNSSNDGDIARRHSLDEGKKSSEDLIINTEWMVDNATLTESEMGIFEDIAEEMNAETFAKFQDESADIAINNGINLADHLVKAAGLPPITGSDAGVIPIAGANLGPISNLIDDARRLLNIQNDPKSALEGLRKAFELLFSVSSSKAENFDLNGNNRLDDDEILQMVTDWIMGNLNDEEIGDAIRLWISGDSISDLPPTEPPTSNFPPTAEFVWQTTVVPWEISFDAENSTDLDGSIKKYEWDFGDGTKAEGQPIKHIFPGDGQYVVRLTVTDDKGVTSTKTQTIQVGNPEETNPPQENKLPTAVIDEGPPSPDPAVSLDASDSDDPDGNIVKYEWDFGDGNKAEGMFVNHTYVVAGEYEVTLTVTDDKGAKTTVKKIITAGTPSEPDPPTDPDPPPTFDPPVASFEMSINSAQIDETVIFNASGSFDPDGEIIAYRWTFGDGSTAGGVVVDHTYTTPGEYTVTLEVVDIQGLTTTIAKTIVITGKE